MYTTIKKVEDNPECLPCLYTEKRRWKVTKKYIRKNIPSHEILRRMKKMKWRMKYILKKDGREVNTIYLLQYYQDNNRYAREAMLEAAFEEDYYEQAFFELAHMGKYELQE
jgi:hypothetical protein